MGGSKVQPWELVNKIPPGNTVGLCLKYWIQCKCEGGKACKYEDPKKQKGPNAVEGLHSSWVNREILAMARPADKFIEEFKIVDQFVELGIDCIINLQELGEHPGCGEGITEGGFSYTPELFMAKGVHFYNFSWRDMGCPHFDLALDIVQVMAYHCRERGGRTAVHCHAGLGRTGLVIACYMVYIDNVKPSEAVRVVRQQRPGALQTAKQENFVQQFAEHLASLRRVFPAEGKEAEHTWRDAVARQAKYLRGAEQQELRHIPKVVATVFAQLLQRGDQGATAVVMFVQQFPGNIPSKAAPPADPEDTASIAAGKQKADTAEWAGLEGMNTNVLLHLVHEWLVTLREPILTLNELAPALAGPPPNQRLEKDAVVAIGKALPKGSTAFLLFLCTSIHTLARHLKQPSQAAHLYNWIAGMILAPAISNIGEELTSAEATARTTYKERYGGAGQEEGVTSTKLRVACLGRFLMQVAGLVAEGGAKLFAPDKVKPKPGQALGFTPGALDASAAPEAPPPPPPPPPEVPAN